MHKNLMNCSLRPFNSLKVLFLAFTLFITGMLLTPVPHASSSPLLDITINVRVTDCATGSPISGARVSAANKSGRTNSNGRASLSPIRPGNTNHTVRISADGYQTASVPKYMEAWSTVSFNICLKKIAFYISGKVFDSSGNPIEGAVISDGLGGTAHSREGGRYKFLNFKPGTYNLTVSYIDLKFDSKSVKISTSNATDINFYAHPKVIPVAPTPKPTSTRIPTSTPTVTSAPTPTPTKANILGACDANLDYSPASQPAMPASLAITLSDEDSIDEEKFADKARWLADHPDEYYNFTSDKYKGECKDFINYVVNSVKKENGSKIGNLGMTDDYIANYINAGFYPISEKEATTGDIIQIYSPYSDATYSSPEAPNGLHTAIIVGGPVNADGSFEVVDSNYYNDHAIHEPHPFNPQEWIACNAKGLIAYYWRYGKTDNNAETKYTLTHTLQVGFNITRLQFIPNSPFLATKYIVYPKNVSQRIKIYREGQLILYTSNLDGDKPTNTTTILIPLFSSGKINLTIEYWGKSEMPLPEILYY